MLFVRWHPPQPRFLKLNFDRPRNYIYTVGGFIIRDWTRKLLKASASYYGETSILVAEARALQNGVCAMIQAGSKNIIIEGDNLTVIQALRGHIHIPWQISMIIADVREKITSSSTTIFGRQVWPQTG